MSSSCEPPSVRLHNSINHPLFRKWNSANTSITPDELMCPFFVHEEDDAKEEIKSMPDVYRYGINQLVVALEPLVEMGLKSILLFGVITKLPKNEIGSFADSQENPVIRAIPIIRKKFPNLVITCDVCLCPYTSHGHCGILKSNGKIDNDKSITRIAQIAVAYAQAGCHIVAPSDMMDGRVGAIKELMEEASITHVAILSYAAKFSSCFYGPFKEGAGSAPAFGDRKCYQLPVGSRGLAKRAVERDVDDGADFLMVKPGMAYLDILFEVKQEYPDHPLFVYQVSGEYAMLIHAAKNGVVDLKCAIEETLTCFRRAGADCIITYFTPKILEWLAKKN